MKRSIAKCEGERLNSVGANRRSSTLAPRLYSDSSEYNRSIFQIINLHNYLRPFFVVERDLLTFLNLRERILCARRDLFVARFPPPSDALLFVPLD